MGMNTKLCMLIKHLHYVKFTESCFASLLHILVYFRAMKKDLEHLAS